MFYRLTSIFLTSIFITSLTFPSAFSVQDFKITKELEMMVASSTVVTVTVSDKFCHNVDAENKILAIEHLKEYMVDVSAEDIETMKEKIFLIYNMNRKMSESDKILEVKKALEKLHPTYSWTGVKIEYVAHSIAFNKFYTYRIKCKYIIGMAGIKC